MDALSQAILCLIKMRLLSTRYKKVNGMRFAHMILLRRQVILMEQLYAALLLIKHYQMLNC